jgi:hypothetical protein
MPNLSPGESRTLSKRRVENGTICTESGWDTKGEYFSREYIEEGPGTKPEKSSLREAIDACE